MQEKNILLCFLAVPLRHKIVAAVIAVAICSGFFAWSRHGATGLITIAELWFDAGAARQGQPGVMQTKEPAVALAQWILSDEAVRGLAKRVGVKSDVAAFRHQLEIAQPSANLLHVNYHDGDKRLSVAVTNAVADLLVDWMPPPVVPVIPDPVLSPPMPVATPAVARPRRHGRTSRVQHDDLRELEAQLAATDQKLSALDSAPQVASVPRKADTNVRPSSSDNEQRRALESQLSAAQKKLDELHVRYTDEYPDVETARENIAEIQQKLAFLQPVSNEREQPASSQKPEVSAIEASQLRQERARLVQAIAAEKRREAMAGDQAAPAQEASPAHASQAIVRQQPATPVAGAILQSPFTLVRLATYDETGSWWHGVLAGILCGFLYLSSAVWRYLPVQGAAAREPLAPKNDQGAVATMQSNGSADFESWEQEIRNAIALTDIGRQEEGSAARDKELASQHRVHDQGSEPKGQLRYDEVSEAIREKIKREPNSWMAHTEEARVALAGGDYDTAVKEIKLAMTVAPEKMKPQLDKIITQLDKNISVKQRAAYGV